MNRFRVHFRELNYYQSVVDAVTPEAAVRIVQESPPELTFMCCEERTVIGVDRQRKNGTWQELPDELIDESIG